jgi:hypothetical protein
MLAERADLARAIDYPKIIPAMPGNTNRND